MDILQHATDWAQAEAKTSIVFIVFGGAFIVASLVFWRIGRTKMAKAYIFPSLIAGILLVLLGGALYDMYSSAIDGLKEAYSADPAGFVQQEVVRTKGNISTYKNDLFGVFPFIMIGASLLIFFVNRPIWRAIAITVITMLTAIMIVDSHAIAFLEDYHQYLNHF